jgi:hypothetical protein
VRVRLPPLKVGVAPTGGPFAPCWMVTLCISGAMLVNLIATFPAFALNDVGVNFSCPLGSAARGSTLPEAAAGAAEELEDDAELEVDAGAEADEELELLVLFDPPHAATATITAAEASKTTGSFDTESPFKGLGAADLLATTRTRVRRGVSIARPLGWGGSIPQDALAANCFPAASQLETLNPTTLRP